MLRMQEIFLNVPSQLLRLFFPFFFLSMNEMITYSQTLHKELTRPWHTFNTFKALTIFKCVMWMSKQDQCCSVTRHTRLIWQREREREDRNKRMSEKEKERRKREGIWLGVQKKSQIMCPGKEMAFEEVAVPLKALTSLTKVHVSVCRTRWVMAQCWNHAAHIMGPVIANLITCHMLAEGFNRKWGSMQSPF